MGNVAHILLRDLKRLIKAPAALIVVAALLVFPSLYTWYNVVAFWDPYNATSGVRVCVVNQDAGTSNTVTGRLDIGDMLIEQLQANDQLGWVTDKDYDTAMEDLKTGNVYAVYVVPEDFSASLVSPLTGNIKTPHIDYFANEKLGPVSPKITDAVASKLEQQINSAFVSTVTEVVTKAINDAGVKADARISAAQTKAGERVDQTRKSIAEARTTFSSVGSTIDNTRTKVGALNRALGNTRTLVNDMQTVLEDVENEAGALQSSLTDISSAAVPKLSNTLAQLTQVGTKATSLADVIAASTGETKADVDLAASKIQPVIDAMRETASDLDAASKAIRITALSERFSKASQDMTARADEMQATLDGAVSLAGQVEGVSQAASDAAKAVNEVIIQTGDFLSQYASDLHGSVAPALNSGIAQVSQACARLSVAVSGLDSTVEQVRPVLTQLDRILADSKTVMSQTDALVGDVQADLDSVMSDVSLLARSDVIANLMDNGTLNAQNIAAFMGSPTELETTQFYHPNAYGAAMAPLFMNLTFWIGAFMLVIIFLLEVDSEGVAGLKPWQRYLGRFLLFCIIAVAQALICCAGTLALGVQAASVPALFLAASVASLTFLSIIYALSATFRHVGKALCIVLVFAQIPGASGLYPVEMTSSFFQAIYPFLPFTYGIDAMRESIGGFYGSYYANDLLVLGVFFFASMGIGLLLGPLMSNVVRMTSRQVYEGDLYNGEDALTPERPYRLAHMLRALGEKESYRAELEERYARFSHRYPIFIRVSIVLGVGIPVVLGFLLALDAAEKVILLTIFLIWLIALIGFLVVVESQRYSFERQLNLENMSNENLLRIFADRNRLAQANSRLSAHDEATDAGEVPAKGGISNVWRIARNDFSGMFKNVMSVVITIGLVALPSLFAWYNILACWNVFDNTNKLSVAVASDDAGFESDLLPMEINVGEKVLSALRGNDQIKWVFTDSADAIEGVKAGNYYAALVIPEDFSNSLLTFYEDDSNTASINYYVNEKKNAIAPNITGVGADAVSNQVNEVFVDTVSQAAISLAQSLLQAVESGDADERMASLAEHMRNLAQRLDQTADLLGMYSSLGMDTKALMQNGADVISSARTRMQSAASDIDVDRGRLLGLTDGLSGSLSDVRASLEKAESASANLEQRVIAMTETGSSEASRIASKLREKASEIDGRIAKLNEALTTLEELRDALKNGVSTAIGADIEDGKANINITLPDGTVYQSQRSLSDDIDAITSSIDALREARSALNNALISAVTADRPALQAKIDEIDAKIQELNETRDKLRELRDSRVDIEVDYEAQLSAEAGLMIENTIVLDKDIAALEKAIEIMQKASTACTDAAGKLESVTVDIEGRAGSLRELVQKAKSDAAAVKADLESNLGPGVSKLKTDISTLAGDLERGANELRALDPDLASTLRNAATAIGNASSKVDDADAKLHAASQRLRELADAVDNALQTGNTDMLRSILQADAGDLGAALTAPVQINRTALFPSENFGSSMAPLYCTLALFIGALLIMVAMKPEVSRRGREGLVDPKPRHLFFGRFMAVAALSLMQTTLMGLGNMLFLKVQVADPLLFMIGFWFAGLVLAFMIYALVVSFGNLGKAIAVLLLIVQVTACGGSYPLQMLPDFVQMISPWVPATYIVDILQSAMMGVYQNDFWVSMGFLALFIIPFLLLGLVLRKPMERFMKYYVSKVEECKIME